MSPVRHSNWRKKIEVFTDGFTFYRVWRGQSWISKEQQGCQVFLRPFNFFWLSSSWSLLADGEHGHKTQGWHHTHSLVAPANTSTQLALTGCLELGLKFAGSVWGMVPGTVLLGRVGFTLRGPLMNRTFINMDIVLFCWGLACFFISDRNPFWTWAHMHVYVFMRIKHIHTSLFGMWKLETTGRDGKHLFHLYFKHRESC